MSFKKKTLGEHVLYWGDCLEIMPTLGERSIDLIVTDPPYGTSYSSQGGPRVSKNRKSTISNETQIMGDDFVNPKWFSYFYKVLNDGSAFYGFCNFKSYSDFESKIKNIFRMKTPLVWDKGNCGMGDLKGDYGNQIELIIYAVKGRHILNGNRDRNLLSFQRPADAYRLHPMEKPVDLLSYLISKSSKEDDIILDPFMGSGSTGEAAIKLGRRFIGIEKDLKYFKVAYERLLPLVEL